MTDDAKGLGASPARQHLAQVYLENGFEEAGRHLLNGGEPGWITVDFALKALKTAIEATAVTCLECAVLAGSDNSNTTNWQAAEPQVITIRPVAVEQVDRDLMADCLGAMGCDWGYCGDVREGRQSHPIVNLISAFRIQATAAKDEELKRDALNFKKYWTDEREACRKARDQADGYHYQLGEAQARATKAEAELETCRAALEDVERDFKWRADQCRTNPDAFDAKAASVWDFAAQAVKEKRNVV